MFLTGENLSQTPVGEELEAAYELRDQCEAAIRNCSLPAIAASRAMEEEPVVPRIAPLHSGGRYPNSWEEIELDQTLAQSEHLVRGALRNDCSKTQYLRTLLTRALKAAKNA